MILSAKFLILLSGFLTTYFWLNTRKIIASIIAFIVLIFSIVHLFWRFNPFDLLGNSDFTQFLMLAVFGGVSAFLIRDFVTKLAILWNDNTSNTQVYPVRIVYLGFQALFLGLIIMGVYAAIGMNPILKTPYLSVDFSGSIDPRIKPPPL